MLKCKQLLTGCWDAMAAAAAACTFCCSRSIISCSRVLSPPTFRLEGRDGRPDSPEACEEAPDRPAAANRVVDADRVADTGTAKFRGVVATDEGEEEAGELAVEAEAEAEDEDDEAIYGVARFGAPVAAGASAAPPAAAKSAFNASLAAAKSALKAAGFIAGSSGGTA